VHFAAEGRGGIKRINLSPGKKHLSGNANNQDLKLIPISGKATHSCYLFGYAVANESPEFGQRVKLGRTVKEGTVERGA
jgi:hypothetical protein